MIAPGVVYSVIMRRQTEKLLSLGLELPPAERAALARELLRSASTGIPTRADVVAENVSTYGDFAASVAPSVLGVSPSSYQWRADSETGGVGDDLEGVALAQAQAEAALASLKGSPRVVRLEVELASDPFGNPRADIEVILADHPRGGLYSWDQLEPISDLIWKAFCEKAEGGPWPFINFHQESEPEVVDDEGSAAAV